MTMETFMSYVLLPALGTLAGSFLGAAIALRSLGKEIREFRMDINRGNGWDFNNIS